MLVAFFFSLGITCASKVPSVNVLTWWGYLNYPWEQKEVEQQCHVKLSYDQYYSSPEFLRRWSQAKDDYDIIIFEDTNFPVIADSLPKVKSNLYQEVRKYNPAVRKKYYERHYPHNVAFFYQSVTGFLYNQKVITLHPGQSLKSVFSQAKNNLVVLLDDPIVFRELQRNDSGLLQPLSVKTFERIKQNSRIFITNSYNKVFTQPDFAFAFLWSGDAIADLIKANSHYHFMVDPKFSYISSDLLAQLSERPQVACVAKVLTSEPFLAKLQNSVYYFSPYGKDDLVISPAFKSVYKQYLNYLPKLKWIKPMSREKVEKISRAWQDIKLNVGQ